MLALVLTVALFLVGVRLPGDIFAAGGQDKTSLVKDKETTSIVFKQGSGNSYDEIIKDGSSIDLTRNLLVNVNFTAVFDNNLPEEQRINKNDYVEFELGSNLKINDNSTEKVVPVIDNELQLKVCDAIFKNTDDGKFVVRFDFSTGDDQVKLQLELH